MLAITGANPSNSAHANAQPAQTARWIGNLDIWMSASNRGSSILRDGLVHMCMATLQSGAILLDLHHTRLTLFEVPCTHGTPLEGCPCSTADSETTCRRMVEGSIYARAAAKRKWTDTDRHGEANPEAALSLSIHRHAWTSAWTPLATASSHAAAGPGVSSCCQDKSHADAHFFDTEAAGVIARRTTAEAPPRDGLVEPTESQADTGVDGDAHLKSDPRSHK